MRWSEAVREIGKVILKAGQPSIYKVKGSTDQGYKTPGIDDALYTREQLQVVDDDEEKIDKSQRKWVVDKILKKKQKSGGVFYTVRWKNRDFEPTDVRASTLKQDQPELVKKFEAR